MYHSTILTRETIKNSCRTCLSNQGERVSLFDKEDITVDIFKMYLVCTSLEATVNDGLSQVICDKCLRLLREFYYFREMCLRSDETMRRVRDSSDFSPKVEELVGIDYCNDDMDLEEHDESTDDVIEGPTYRMSPEVIVEGLKEEAPLPIEEMKPEMIEEKDLTFLQTKPQVYEPADLFPLSQQLEIKVKRRKLSREEQYRVFDPKKGILVRKFKCKECGKEYTSNKNLQLHENFHRGVKPHVCDQCGKQFTTIHSLRSHKSMHSGQLLYICEVCGKGYSTSTGLKRHEMAHTGVRPFKCEHCNHSFISSGDLTVHRRKHTGEKPYLCQTCGKSFSRVSHFYTHRRVHTGEKPYKCTECDRAFAQSGDLNSHRRTHTGEKPFACNMCDKKFIQHSGLTTHTRIHKQERLYSCNFCKRSFTQASSVTRHVQMCHD